MFFVFSVAALAATYGFVGVLERRPRLRFRALASPRPFLATDVTWFAVAVGASAVSAFLLQPLLSRFAVGPVAEHVDVLPVAAKLGIGVVVFDFVSFLVHRQLHRTDLLWTIHKVHHSSLALDSLATTRTHMLENAVRFVPGQVVLFLLGMPASVVAPTVAVAAIYGISNHSNLAVRVPWLEAILVTPRLHRRHHVPSTTQRNFGTIFTIWDRVAGSLVRADVEADDRYGVPGEIDTYPQRFIDAARQPFRQMRSLRADRRVAVRSLGSPQ